MRNTFYRILYRMRKIVHRIDAPFIAGIMMTHMSNPVYNRISHIDIRACHIYFGTKHFFTVSIYAVFHVLKQLKVFFNRPVSVRAVLSRGFKSPAILFDLVSRQIAYESFSFFDKFNSRFIHLVKIIRCKKESVFPIGPEPLDIRLYRINEFRLFLGGVCIVKSQIELSAILFGKSVIDKYCLGVPDMQIAVGLGRKTGMYLIIFSLLKILVDYHLDKIF